MRHPLTVYRDRTGLSLGTIAAKAGTTRTSVWRIERWEQTPSLGLVARLMAATDGQVTADDFLTAKPPASSHEAA